MSHTRRKKATDSCKKTKTIFDSPDFFSEQRDLLCRVKHTKKTRKRGKTKHRHGGASHARRNKTKSTPSSPGNLGVSQDKQTKMSHIVRCCFAGNNTSKKHALLKDGQKRSRKPRPKRAVMAHLPARPPPSLPNHSKPREKERNDASKRLVR